jgi:hypothetical protein
MVKEVVKNFVMDIVYKIVPTKISGRPAIQK